ncbi:MAG: Smr/MutS family protein [Thiohalomonadaceae bacterium]
MPFSDDEAELFREAVADARPLKDDRVPLAGRRPPPAPVRRMEDERAVMRELLDDSPLASECETGEELLFARPGLQNSVLRKLRRGAYSVSGQLDLHGLRVAEARTAVADFLAAARARGARCVRIIHGKGHGSAFKQPVLKVKVNHWLRQRDEVLAFTSAPPADGGTGAVYVLLRRL